MNNFNARDNHSSPNHLSLLWNLLYLVLIALTILLALVLYPTMPEQIPLHANLVGEVDRWTSKSYASVLGFPVLFELLFAVIFPISQAAFRFANPYKDKDVPKDVSDAYILYCRAWSIYLLVLGLGLASVVGIGFVLSSAGIITLMQLGITALILTVCSLVVLVALMVVYGQNGAKLIGTSSKRLIALGDDSDCWKLGIIYVNKDDLHLFVPKRFGVGWAINFARPASWILLACFIFFDVLLVATILVTT